MVFSSLIFICFFMPITFILYYLVPGIRAKNILLVACSLIFYAWGGIKYLPVLLVIVMVNYLFGLLIDRWKRNAKYLLAVGVMLNLLVLCYFKYFMFIQENINKFFNNCLKITQIVLPIGISFYIFQGLSYLIDVYRHTVGNSKDEKLSGCEVQKNPIKLLLYISFFPQLIAGPIVRYSTIHKQIDERKHSLDKVSAGLERFVFGLAKKVIIADTLGLVADRIFGLKIDYLAGDIAWIGAICYSFQIYFDFMGYSDMAIGLANLFGFDFLENFNYPYTSKSITEFWRRWHISLSSWFRDYVYIPLGGNRTGNVYFHLLVVFALTGFWHGANWTFVAWGLWHGLFIILERYFKKFSAFFSKIPNVIKWIYAMAVTGVGWVFFRADTVKDAIGYLKAMTGLATPEFQPFGWRYYMDDKAIFVLILAAILSVLPFSEWIKKIKSGKGEWLIKVFNVCLLIICLIIIINSSYSPFIYFRF